jgi:hypothetical protein
MSLNEADTRAKLIDPAIHKHGWTEDLIRREETAGTVEIISGKPRRRSRGKIDYVLRVKVNVDTQPVALEGRGITNATTPTRHRACTRRRRKRSRRQKGCCSPCDSLLL